MADGPSGSIRMSEKTYSLIQLNQFIVDTLDFQKHQNITVEKKAIQTYTCEQIFIGIESDDEISEDFDDEDSVSSESDKGYEPELPHRRMRSRRASADDF